MLFITVFSGLRVTAFAWNSTVTKGSLCSENQIVSNLTYHENETTEIGCGPVTCGEVGRRCIEDQTECRGETNVLSGMRSASNGESVLLHCCTMKYKKRWMLEMMLFFLITVTFEEKLLPRLT